MPSFSLAVHAENSRIEWLNQSPAIGAVDKDEGINIVWKFNQEIRRRDQKLETYPQIRQKPHQNRVELQEIPRKLREEPVDLKEQVVRQEEVLDDPDQESKQTEVEWKGRGTSQCKARVWIEQSEDEDGRE